MAGKAFEDKTGTDLDFDGVIDAALVRGDEGQLSIIADLAAMEIDRTLGVRASLPKTLPEQLQGARIVTIKVWDSKTNSWVLVSGEEVA